MAVDTLGQPNWEYIFSSAGSVHVGSEMIREGSHTYVVSGYYLDEFGDEQYYQTKFDLSNLSNTTSIESVNGKTKLSLYPNPVSDVLVIQQDPSTKPERMVIRNSMGAIVDIINPLSSITYYECHHLNAGVYYLTQVGASASTQQFVVR
jgi:hypothetical protein